MSKGGNVSRGLTLFKDLSHCSRKCVLPSRKPIEIMGGADMKLIKVALSS